MARRRQRRERQSLQGRSEERRVQDARRRRDLSESASPVILGFNWLRFALARPYPVRRPQSEPHLKGLMDNMLQSMRV